jgi:hypothetical protein
MEFQSNRVFSKIFKIFWRKGMESNHVLNMGKKKGHCYKATNKTWSEDAELGW